MFCFRLETAWVNKPRWLDSWTRMSYLLRWSRSATHLRLMWFSFVEDDPKWPCTENILIWHWSKSSPAVYSVPSRQLRAILLHYLHFLCYLQSILLDFVRNIHVARKPYSIDMGHAENRSNFVINFCWYALFMGYNWPFFFFFFKKYFWTEVSMSGNWNAQNSTV